VHFGPLVTEDAAPSAVAWSANGKYIALNGLKLGPMAASPSGVRLFASDTLEKKGNIAPAKHHRCNIALSQDMAFTADSKALWVSCGRYGTPSPLPIAIKLGVPGLEIDDSLFPVLLAPDTQFEFQTYEISTGNDGLALTGISRPARLAPPDYQQQMAVQSFSLETKTQLHPPVLMNLYYGDGEPFGVRTALGLHLIRDLSAVLIHFPGAAFGRSGRSYAELAELWSTARGGRLDAGQSHTIYERYLPPNRIGQSGMHLQTHANPDPSRYRRTHLIVLDSQTGATIQQLGPIATGTGGAKILVSPTGNRVALVSRDEIRFYRVNQ
jgi:hypothetical protein